MHSREDVAVACLQCFSDESCRALVTDFCIGRANKLSFEDYSSVLDGSRRMFSDGDIRAYDHEEMKARLTRSEHLFIARVFSTNVRSIVDIALDIFNFFFVSKIE